MDINKSSQPVCDLAQDRYRNAALWLNLWTILLWLFGAILIIFFSFAMIFFVRQDWLPTALGTIGTIVGGTGIKWVVDRRIDAKKEEEGAYKKVTEACINTTTADTLKTKLTLFGKML